MPTKSATKIYIKSGFAIPLGLLLVALVLSLVGLAMYSSMNAKHSVLVFQPETSMPTGTISIVGLDGKVRHSLTSPPSSASYDPTTYSVEGSALVQGSV